jgi:hypothetical protein
MSNVVDKVVTKVQGNLETQYAAFRVMMWADLVIGCLFAAAGNFPWAFGLVIVGLILGNISNAKLSLLNQEQVLTNQARIEDKLDVLLEEGVQ